MLQLQLKIKAGGNIFTMLYKSKMIRIIKNFDVILVAVGLIVGYMVIVIHLTGIWPCSIINKIDKSSLNNLNLNVLSLNEETYQKFIDDMHYLLTNLFLCK
jgi:hypothetical protein